MSHAVARLPVLLLASSLALVVVMSVTVDGAGASGRQANPTTVTGRRVALRARLRASDVRRRRHRTRGRVPHAAAVASNPTKNVTTTTRPSTSTTSPRYAPRKTASESPARRNRPPRTTVAQGRTVRGASPFVPVEVAHTLRVRSRGPRRPLRCRTRAPARTQIATPEVRDHRSPTKDVDVMAPACDQNGSQVRLNRR